MLSPATDLFVSLYRKCPQKKVLFVCSSSILVLSWAHSSLVYTTPWTAGIQVKNALLASKSSDQSPGRIWQICWLLPATVFIWISGLHSLVPTHLSSYCFTVFLLFIASSSSHLQTTGQLKAHLIPCVTSSSHLALKIQYLQLWLLLWTRHSYFLLAILFYPFISLIFNLFVPLQLACFM